MTQDEIIEMAKEASFTNHSTFEKCLVCNPDSLLHFTNLVAQEVRDRIMFGSRDDWVLAEREACAKLCDELSDKHTWEGCYADECAQAIRARGEQA